MQNFPHNYLFQENMDKSETRKGIIHVMVGKFTYMN